MTASGSANDDLFPPGRDSLLCGELPEHAIPNFASMCTAEPRGQTQLTEVLSGRYLDRARKGFTWYVSVPPIMAISAAQPRS